MKARLWPAVLPVLIAVCSEVSAQVCVAPSFGFLAPPFSSIGVQPREFAVADFDDDGLLDFAVANELSDSVDIFLGTGVSFSPSVSLNPLPGAYAVDAADVDHDGNVDLAIVSQSNGNVWIALGDGFGDFTAPANIIPSDGAPGDVHIGDFDKDGDPDLAVAYAGTPSVAIHLGDGTGGFSSPAPLAMGFTFGMEIGDVDNDGHLDVVTADAGFDQIVVALGAGNGTLNPPTPYATGRGPSALVVRDFDKNGVLDVVTVDQTDGTITFLQGIGGGAFSATFTTGVGPNLAEIDAADVDGDGILDVIVPLMTDAQVAVYLGDGTGSFVTPGLFGAPDTAQAVASGDFDRDGRVDFITSVWNVDQVAVFTNDYNINCFGPSFDNVGSYEFVGVGTNPRSMVTGDFDGDSNPDYVTANQSANTITIALGQGDRLFGVPTSFGITGVGPVSIAAADFTSDGFLDVVTANQTTNDLTVMQGTGTGLFAADPALGLSAAPNEVAAVDISFDGKVDLIVALSSGAVAVALGVGDGTFNTFTDYAIAASALGSVDVGDFDKDGLLDIVATEPTANQIHVLQNVGGGAFSPSGPTGVGGSPTSVRAGFFNGGGDLDVVVTLGSGPGGSLQPMFGDGALGFTPGAGVLIAGGPSTPAGVVVSDFNRDGAKDVAVAIVERFGVLVLHGNGSGGFPTNDLFDTGAVPAGAGVADFDRDGFPDLTATIPVLDTVAAMPNDGTGNFGPPPYQSAGNDGRSVASGDFDHDGKVDLVTADAGANSISIFRNLGGATFGPASTTTVVPSLRPVWVLAGDFDCDGNLDVVTSNEGSTNLTFLPGDGAGGFGVGAPSAVLFGTPGAAHAADVDRDGDLDIAVITGAQVEVMVNDGFGNFNSVANVGLGGAGAFVHLADYDLDGDVDIAATQVTDNTLEIRWQTGVLTFGAGPNFTLSNDPLDFDAADLNGDGALDFAVPTSTTNRVHILLSSSPGVWSPAPVAPTPPEPVSVRTADINRDGLVDMIVATRSGQLLSFQIGDGAGGFVVQEDRLVGVRRPEWLAIDDFNMDGRPDVAVVGDTRAGTSPPPGVVVVVNTNCLAMRVVVQTEISTCDSAGFPFSTQPAVSVLDDGDNTIQCALNPILASIVPGTGTGGAVLSGINPRAPLSGIASFIDLEIDVGGAGYQLEYTHPTAPHTLFSRTFSLDLSASITGPAAVCETDLAIFDGGPGYEMYNWLWDASPVSMAQVVDLTGTITPGVHTIDLNVEQDTCTAFDSQLVDVTQDLVSATIGPLGPESVCEICTGTLMNSVVLGGGLPLYQWGYRNFSLGPITDIPGATGPDYLIDGTDFPSTSTFFLVVTVTPECGTAITSNEVQVDVSAATAPNPLDAISTLATDLNVRIEWALPSAGACNTVRIIRRDDGSFPTNPNDLSPPNFLIGDFACTGLKGTTDDTGVSNDITYHYAGWVSDGSTFSTDVPVTARPFDDTLSPIRWAYATGAASVAAPGLRILSGVGTVYIVSNDFRVHAVDGTTGHWPTNWTPHLMLGAGQNRPPATNFLVGTGPPQAPNGAVFVGSQDGDVYAIDADEGDIIWQKNVAGMVQASPAGVFFGFGGPQNLILVGSRDSGVPNVFRAFDVEDGSHKWAFDNGIGQGGDGADIGIISGGAAVDYTNERVFFGSHKAGNDSVFSIDFSSGSPVLEWAADIGDTENSPIYLRSPGRLVIGNNASEVHMLDPDNLGAPLWTSPYNAADGRVKGFVFPQFGTPFYIFSTDNNVTSIRDNGPATIPSFGWNVPLSNPSIPLHFPGTDTVLVGAASGELYQITNLAGPPSLSGPVVLGDGTSVVGAPSINGFANIIYVGTTQGIIYAVDYPLP